MSSIVSFFSNSFILFVSANFCTPIKIEVEFHSILTSFIYGRKLASLKFKKVRSLQKLNVIFKIDKKHSALFFMYN